MTTISLDILDQRRSKVRRPCPALARADDEWADGYRSAYSSHRLIIRRERRETQHHLRATPYP